jgi:hypothetical protein
MGERGSRDERKEGHLYNEDIEEYTDDPTLPLEIQILIARFLAASFQGFYKSRLVCRFWREELGKQWPWRGELGQGCIWKELLQNMDWKWREELLDTQPGDILNITLRNRLSRPAAFSWEQYACVHCALHVIHSYQDRRAEQAAIALLHCLNNHISNIGRGSTSYGLYVLYTHNLLSKEDRKRNWKWLEDSFFLFLENQEKLKEVAVSKGRVELLAYCELRYLTRHLHQAIQQGLKAKNLTDIHVGSTFTHLATISNS